MTNNKDPLRIAREALEQIAETPGAVFTSKTNAGRMIARQALAQMDQLAPSREAPAVSKEAADLVEAGREAERCAILEWLREEAQLCDCFAREAGECACGAWYDYKTMPVERLADAIENKEHRNDAD